MKIILIILILSISLFTLVFLIGFVTAAITDRKRRRAHAIVLLSQIPKEVTEKLVKILMAHKNRDTDEINSIVCAIGYSKLEQLCELIGPDNRPVHLSSGNFGDNLSWTAMENSLQKQGYTIISSKIITGIMLNDLDVVLKEINKYLRVILLEDGETIHNAFFDRNFKEVK